MALNSSTGESILKFAPAMNRLLGRQVMHSVNTGGGLYAKAQAVVTTTTAQSMTFKALRGYGDDYFNGWYAVGQECTNIAELEANRVTDYTSRTGIFSFGDDWSGNPAKNDVLRIISPEAMAAGSTGRWIRGTLDATPLLLTNMDLWSTTGPVVITGLFGIVTTTAVEAQATTTKITFDPDDGGSDVDLCATVDATGAATGKIIRLTGDVSDAAIISLDVAEAFGYNLRRGGLILSQAGDIKVIYGAQDSDGQINWYIRYESINSSILTPA